MEELFSVDTEIAIQRSILGAECYVKRFRRLSESNAQNPVHRLLLTAPDILQLFCGCSCLMRLS